MFKRLGTAAIVLLLTCSYALAQATVRPCVTTGQNQCPPVSAANPLPITGSFSSAGFTPGDSYASPLAVTTTTGRVALPTGTVVVAYNTGAVAAYCHLGNASVNATVVHDQVAPGGFFSFTVGVNTHLACITASSTTTINLSGGLGQPAGSGGGGGSGGGAVTQSGTWTVQPGNTANTTAWKVDGSAVTQPVSLTSTTITGTVASTQSGTWTVTGAGGTFPAVLGAETTKVIGTVRNLGNVGGVFDAVIGAATPANGLLVGMAQGGLLTALSGTSGNLNVQCANCSGSGVSTADAATFTASTSLFAGGGGFFQTTATSNALTNGQQGMFQATANRALFVNPRDSAGLQIFGAQGDVVCGTDDGTCSGLALAKRTNARLTDLVTNTGTIATNTAKGAAATGAAVPTDAIYMAVNVGGFTTGLVGDPCQTNAATYKSVTIPTATTTNILTGTSAKKIYICYMYLQTGLANNVAIISGTTGATCGANTAALVGGVTAATGLVNAANSGQAFGNGGFSTLATLTNADDICVITSAAGPLSIAMKYVVQ